MITEDRAKSAIEKACSCGLYGSQWMWGLGIQRVVENCNGCGPEWMGAGCRDLLTRWLSIFFPAFCIHDCRFAFSNDGSRERFDSANDELRRNCLILANAEYGWYNPLRYLWRHRANIVADACEDFGWSAWRDAYGLVGKTGEAK